MTGEEQAAVTDLKEIVTTYLTVGLMPGAAASGNPVGRRNEREMRTLAEALDALLSGNLAQAGDIMMQRFRACEMSVQEGDWTLAQHLELIPDQRVSCIPQGMREELVREENQQAMYRKRAQQATQK